MTQLFQAVRRLADERSDPEIGPQFQVASALHINFYEGWLPEGTVQESLEAVRQLVDKLVPPNP